MADASSMTSFSQSECFVSVYAMLKFVYDTTYASISVIWSFKYSSFVADYMHFSMETTIVLFKVKQLVDNHKKHPSIVIYDTRVIADYQLTTSMTLES